MSHHLIISPPHNFAAACSFFVSLVNSNLVCWWIQLCLFGEFTLVICRPEVIIGFENVSGQWRSTSLHINTFKTCLWWRSTSEKIYFRWWTRACSFNFRGGLGWIDTPQLQTSTESPLRREGRPKCNVSICWRICNPVVILMHTIGGTEWRWCLDRGSASPCSISDPGR